MVTPPHSEPSRPPAAVDRLAGQGTGAGCPGHDGSNPAATGGAADEIAGPSVAGVDEAGRGPLAGPVVAAAVVLDPARPVVGLADSKRLSPARRERLAATLREHARAVSIAVAEVDEIDRVNILGATLAAMGRAVAGLAPAPARVHVDGDRAPALGVPVEAVVGGDAADPAISAASIVAKVERDRLLAALDGRYPGYGFAGHKGYATRAHLEALQRLGPCPAHRRSFAPVRAAADQ